MKLFKDLLDTVIDVAALPVRAGAVVADYVNADESASKSVDRATDKLKGNRYK